MQIIDLGRGTQSGQQQQHVMVNMDTFSFFSNALLSSCQSYISKIKTNNNIFSVWDFECHLGPRFEKKLEIS